nr:MAG TPA: hypothetical protein [Bacteriophage sp.]
MTHFKVRHVTNCKICVIRSFTQLKNQPFDFRYNAFFRVSNCVITQILK